MKYIKKGDLSRKLLDEKIAEAKNQLEQYSGSLEFAGIDNLLKVILIFCNDKLVYDEKL